MKILSYTKLVLLLFILVLVYLDYRCCKKDKECCHQQSNMESTNDSLIVKKPADIRVMPQLSATSIIVIYDFPTSGPNGNADARLEKVDVDIYKQDERTGTYPSDASHHITRQTDQNGEVFLNRGIGTGNYLIMASDGNTGATNEVRITANRCITDTVYLPLNLKCGSSNVKDPAVKEEPVVKEAAKKVSK